jgi:hypothetical protein
MTVTAAEIQTHLNAGEKAAPQEVVDYVKAKGVASLKVHLKTCINKIGNSDISPVEHLRREKT